MGRSKPSGTAAPAESGGEVPPPAEEGVCAICTSELDLEDPEGYISVQCSRCGRFSLHLECAVGYLEEYIKRDNSNSVCIQKYKVLVHKRPKYFMSSEGVKCPRTSGSGRGEGGAAGSSKGSKNSKGKGAAVVAGSCPGTCIDADMIKPVKQAPPPLPQPAWGKQAAAGGGKQPAAGSSKQPANGSGTASKAAVASKAALAHRPAPFPKSSSGAGQGRVAGGAASSSSRAPGLAEGKLPKQAGAPSVWPVRGHSRAHRPVELTLCLDAEAGGKCYVFGCRRAHSESELRQREREWAEWEYEEDGGGEAVEQDGLQVATVAWPSLSGQQEEAATEDATEGAAGFVPGHTLPAAAEAGGGAPWGGSASFSQVAAGKAQCLADCIGMLVQMGFPRAAAEAAAEATGWDAELAAQMLLEQQRCGLLWPDPGNDDTADEEAAGVVDEWVFDAAPSIPEEASPSGSISTSMPFSAASGLAHAELDAGYSEEAAQGNWLMNTSPMPAQPAPGFASGSADVFAGMAAAEQLRPNSDIIVGSSSVSLKAAALTTTPAVALPVPPLPAALKTPDRGQIGWDAAQGSWQGAIPVMDPHGPGFAGPQPGTPPPAQQQAASSPPVLLPFGRPRPAQRSLSPAPHHYQVYPADPASHPTGAAFDEGFAAAAAAAAAAAQQHHMQQQHQQAQQHQQFQHQYSMGGQHPPQQLPQPQQQYSMRGQLPPWEQEQLGGYYAPPTSLQHPLDGPFHPPLHALPPHLQQPPHMQQPLPTPAQAQPEEENLDDLLGLMGIA